MRRNALFALILTGTAVLCLTVLRPALTQSGGLRRITNTTEEGINLNPSISGDGRIVAFESTEDVAGAGGSDHFRAIRANIGVDPATFFQMGGTRAVAPAISQDGSRIAFASKDDPLGTNQDGNSEIFLFDGAKLIQVTNTSPGNLADRVTNGNFQPSISDDGRFIAFSSNRDLAGQNVDGNLELFVYDTNAATFTQLTNSSGIVGFSDAKISGDGATVAYIRDVGATPSTARDLLKQPRVGPGPLTVLAAGVPSLAMTYGRAISDDGARVVYSAQTVTNTTQVFLFDGRAGGVTRQITSLGARVTEVPLHPTISGDGSRIAFAARRSVSGAPSNSDGGVELYVYDLPTATFSKITNAPSSATADIVSSLSDDGSIVAFNFPRILSGAVANSDSANNSEIYATAPPVRPANGTLTAILNGASFGHEPSSIKAVAPDSIVAAQGSNLANTTLQSQRLPNGTFPTNVGGTRVTVNGRAAQIFFVSPTQVNFLMPPQTEIGTAEVIVTNSENFPSRGTVPTLRAAPGIFTKSGDGIGEGMILNADTLQEGPFDPTGGNLRLSVFATGARNAAQVLVLIGGRSLNTESINTSDMSGLDEIHVRVPADLRGAGTVNLSVIADGRDSNPVTVTFIGDPGRAIFINEVLADPPAGIAGDANHDGVRDGTQDEFVELVNGSGGETTGVGGWTIKTRPTGSTTETTRFTFPAGTSVSPGEALVVFGGGGANFNPNDGVFGCAQVFRVTSSSGLSLTNGGLTILIRNTAGNLIAQFEYGGSTGLDGNNSQSLTRSPDITGSFVQHTAAMNANGRRFSPGLRTDGTPFVNCPGRLTSVNISPSSASVVVGQTTQFTAQAFDQYGRPMTGITINFASDNPGVATIDSVSTNSSTGVATATVRARNPAIAHITASATDGLTTVNSAQSTLTVTGPALSINDVSKNEGNSGTTTFTFTVSLSTPAPVPVTFDIATQDNTATVANNDYVARSLTAQTIPAGQQTYNFDVSVNGDVDIEQNKSFFVNVTNVSGASVADAQGVGTILTDDIPTLSVNDVSANEGNSGTTIFTFTVTSSLPAPAGGITFDIATANGTATAASGDYVARALTNQTIPAGQTSYLFDVTVNGDTLVEPGETFFVNLSNVSANASISDGQGVGTIQNDDTATLVISQVYGGGNNSGAPFRNDFVELYNRGATTVDFAVTPYSIQYASVGSNFSSSNITNLTTGMLAPGRYFLVQEAGGTTNGVALPAPDATGSIAMAGTSGKVALVAGTSALAAATCPGDDGSSPFNPNNSSIADFVGYGNTATTAGHCYEGSGPATAPSNTTSDFRKAGGCVDTNDNASDFFTASPNPRNSASPVGDCKPEITINDPSSVTEGNTGTKPLDFTVSLSSSSAQTITVNYATADDTATAPADYQAASGVLTFDPGEVSKTITIQINGDTLDEPTEHFFVNLSSATNAVILDGQGQGTISDNDPTPSLAIDDVSVAEGDSGTTPMTFTVSLSAASGQTVTVDYATADNTAIAGSDYESNSGSLTFNPGDTSKTITVLVDGDITFEPNETLFVNLSNPTNASITDTQGQGTITNDDAAPPTPTFFINDPSIAEGNSGTSIATFNVTLSPASANTVTVDYATANGNATASTDYQSASNTLTFNPGDTSKPISVTINGDTLVEPDETFFVNLTNATGGAAIGDPQAVGTITNDDTANLVISQVYGGGNNSGATFKNDYVELFNRGTTTVDLAGWSVQQASATGTSWSVTALCPSGSCLIAPGKYFLVKESPSSPTIGADLPAPDATGTSNLATTSGKIALVNNSTTLTGSGCPFGASIADFVGYGTTADCSENSTPAPAHSNTTADFRKAGGCTDTNDNAADFFTSTPSPRNSSSPANNCAGGATPNLTINDVTVTEGNSGATTATFTVSLSAPAQGSDVTFDIATQNNNALSSSDYVTRSLTSQVIPAGQTTYAFDVTINGDTTVEPDETFFVNVTNVTGANVTDGQGLGTIQNDDQPALSIDDVSLAEGNSGTKLFSFHVTLSAASTSAVTFDIATQDNTATVANNDYVARSLSAQTIPAGSTSYTFDVTVNGDLNIESNETFFVNISNVSGATVAKAQGVGTITNDDSPTLTINDLSIAEGDSGTSIATFTVTLSPATNQAVTVDYTTANGTASSGSDYQTASNTLTFNIGDTTKQLNVTINGDTLVEPDETFFVNLTNATGGATIGDSQGVGTITNDDTANLKISQVYPGGGLTGATYTNDFIEVFNRGTTTVDFSVTHYSAQFLSTSGSTWAKTDLTSGTVAPGQYFLVKESSGGAVGAALPTADATGTINLTSTTPGKVALVAGATLLTGNCPGDDSVQPFNPVNASVADFVGYSGTASTANHCYEGAAPAAFTSGNNTTADFRKAGGCIDTNDNAADFFTASPFPRNSSSPTNNCAGVTPNLTIDDVTVTEGNSGTTTATFTVSLSAPAQGQDVTFDIATQDNTATTANNDYVAIPLTSHTIPAGQTSFTFNVTVNGDTAVEPDETLFVNVTNVVGANVTDGQGIGTIQHDDVPTLSIDDVTATEGDAGTKTFTFHMSLSANAPATVTFDIATADGSATVADNDYVFQSVIGKAIAAGASSTTFDVTVNGDMNIESNETFFVNVSNVTGATVLDGQGQGTIQNDDSPVLSINNVSGSEGNSGPKIFTFTVTSTLPAPAGGITFDIATADNTATSSSGDYVAHSLTGQTIPAGQTTYTFDVTVNGDTSPEPDETFFVNVSNASGGGATISGGGQGTGTIQNDDGAFLVISQVYPGGGLTGATYTNDFIELFNRGTTAIDFALTPYSVQFLSTGGSTWAKTDLTSGTLAPGHYFLVKEAGGATGAALPTADATGTLNITSTTAGKVALVAGTTLLTGSCPGDDGSAPFNPAGGTIADFVGYGATASTLDHCYEGSGPASYTLGNNTTADFRKFGGCQDTNDNAADFDASTPGPRNTSSSVNDCTAADLGITKTDSPDPVITGSNVTYTITATNFGPATAQSVVIGDNLPANVTFVSCASTGTGACNGSDNNRTINFVSLAAGSFETITLVATANGPAGTPISNSASVSSSTTDPNSANNTATATTNVNSPTFADLAIVKTDSPDPVFPTGALTYTLSVTNNGPDTAQSVLVTDNLPSEVTFVDCASNQSGVCGGTSTSPTISFTSLASGVTATITIHATVNSSVTAGTVITNTVSVTSATTDSTPGNNTDSEDTTIQELNAGDLLISEFRTRGPVGASDEFVEIYNPTTTTLVIGGLRIRASNGSGTVSDRVNITAGTTLGPGCHYLIANSSASGYSGATAPNQTYTTGITDDGGIAITRANGTTIIDQVGMSVGSAYKEGTTLTALSLNVEQSYERKPGGSFGNGTDTNNNANDFFLNASSSNPQNSSTGCLNTSAADLSITKSDSPDPVTIGSNVTYTITVLSNGAATAQNVLVTDNLPTEVTFVSCNSTGAGVCGGTGNNRTVTVASLASGASITITIVATANGPHGATATNTATVSSATPDSDAGNNSATATTLMQEPTPNLSIDDVTVTEGNSGTTNAVFTVTLSPTSSQTVTVDYATSSTVPSAATAAAGTDYQTPSGTLTFNPGEPSKTITVLVNGDTTNEAICETYFVNLSNATNASILDGTGQGGITDDDGTKLVISQVYGAGGNSGATYTNDFIEIFNRGNVAVSLNGLSVQYSAATSTSGSFSVTTLPNVSLQPGQYFLIQESGGANGSPLPTPDVSTGTIVMAATAGKVALVNGTGALSAAGCPSGATILDFVGYGTTANCREGSSTSDNAGAPSATTSDQRKLSACQDTGNNNNDFSVATPGPRNTSTATNICSCSSSYSSLLILGDSWQNSLAMASADRPLSNRGW